MSEKLFFDKTLRLPQFSGRNEDWPIWSGKFKIRARRKGYKDLMLGTETIPDDADKGLTKDIDKKGVSPKFRRLFELIRLEISHGPGAYNEYICNNPKKLDVLALVVGNMMSGPGSMAAALQYLTLDLFYENQLDMLLQDRSLIPEAVNESLRFRAGPFCHAAR